MIYIKSGGSGLSIFQEPAERNGSPRPLKKNCKAGGIEVIVKNLSATRQEKRDASPEQLLPSLGEQRLPGRIRQDDVHASQHI
jgi:hypothetical protein